MAIEHESPTGPVNTDVVAYQTDKGQIIILQSAQTAYKFEQEMAIEKAKRRIKVVNEEEDATYKVSQADRDIVAIAESIND